MTVYRPAPRYLLFALAGLVMAGLFAWELTRRFDAGSALYLVISVLLVLWNTRAALTRVALLPDRITLTAPLARPREIEFRQLMSVTEEGRMGRASLVAYHPHTGDGLLDLDDVETAALPMLQDQDTLYATLAKRTPA